MKVDMVEIFIENLLYVTPEAYSKRYIDTTLLENAADQKFNSSRKRSAAAQTAPK